MSDSTEEQLKISEKNALIKFLKRLAGLIIFIIVLILPVFCYFCESMAVLGGITVVGFFVVLGIIILGIFRLTIQDCDYM